MRNYIDEAFPADPYLRERTLRKILSSRHAYVIFFIARSGSTWLTEMSALDGRLGAPQEWFNPAFILNDEEVVDDGHVTTYIPPKIASISDINEYAAYLAHRYASNDGRVIGAELAIDHLRALVERIERPGSLRRNCTYFYLRRKNIVAQAISHFRSCKSGYWHSYHPESSRQRYNTLSYDFSGILESLELLAQHEIAFQAFFERHGIVPKHLCYEDMVADMQSVLDSMAFAVTKRHSAPVRPVKAGRLRKLSGAENVEWEQTFRCMGSAELAKIEQHRPPFNVDGYRSRILTWNGSTSEHQHRTQASG